MVDIIAEKSLELKRGLHYRKFTVWHSQYIRVGYFKYKYLHRKPLKRH